ncbi:MAG: PepSY domain-containing protein [Bacteroidota bacterium]
MLAKVWRYSHFVLALSSGVFVLLAAVTGAILAFEPIETNMQPFYRGELSEISLAQLIDSLGSHYDEILELEIDENEFLRVSVISMEEDLDGDFYVDPRTGRKIGDLPQKRPLYEFLTNLHRSLFLKTPGRIFIGITSFLLFLISITGFLLFLQRQKGLRRFFDTIVKEDFAQFYHVILSRWMLIPIIIISLSGVYLSFLRFEIIPEKPPELIHSFPLQDEETGLRFSDFPIFQETMLAEVRKLEFPFSPDVEDFFILSLQEQQLHINQKDGTIVEELSYPMINRISTLSLQLHTGAGSIIWSIVLFLASINILFFLYSGYLISFRRLRARVRNQIHPNEAEIVILYGSENGSTREFASILQKALLGIGKSVYLDELNAYRSFDRMWECIILTSTYGDGDPPSNANRFLALFAQTPLAHPVNCSIVGFGSLAYEHYCQFALDVHAALSQHDHCILQHAPYLIHNKSYASFHSWIETWSQERGFELNIPTERKVPIIKSNDFEVLDKQIADDSVSDTFVLTLKSRKKNFYSGDLLAIYPPGDPVERLYSIAKIDKNSILLCVKRHEMGLCSNYLYDLYPQSILEGQIRKNGEFYFPSHSKSVCLIANGTGIAPFLGMILEQNNGTEVSLYWGGKTSKVYELYKPYVDKALQQGKLSQCKTVFSQGDHAAEYVQDIISEDGEKIIDQLYLGGTIMICGSIAMQQEVCEMLDILTLKHFHLKLSHFEQKGQILTDCY